MQCISSELVYSVYKVYNASVANTVYSVHITYDVQAAYSEYFSHDVYVVYDDALAGHNVHIVVGVCIVYNVHIA